MNVRNGSIDAVDISRRIRSFFYSYLFTSLNSIIDLNAKNPDVRFCLKLLPRMRDGRKANIQIRVAKPNTVLKPSAETR